MSTNQLLLYSLSEFESIIFECFEIANVKNIVEIGSESGNFTAQLIQWVEQVDGRLYCIDPNPSEQVRELCNHSDRVFLITDTSTSTLPTLETCDAYLVDGDHNYYTVSQELQAIASRSQNTNQDVLIFLHDVCWPCGYRDLYYSPESLPPEEVHPYSYNQGVTIESKQLIEGGFRGEGAFAWAVDEGGKANGVMSAVEDFLSSNQDFSFVKIPCIFGLGIIYTSSSKYSKNIIRLFDEKIIFNLLEKLEKNRIDLYLHILKLQDEINKKTKKENAFTKIFSPFKFNKFMKSTK